MDDVTAQFFVMLGDICDDARLGHLPVRLTLADGTVIEGIPDSARQPSPGDAGPLDDTGVRTMVVIDGVRVALPEVSEVSVVRPTDPAL